MLSRSIAAIDPGQNGGYAIFKLTGELVEVGRLQTVPLRPGHKSKRKLVDAVHLRGILLKHDVAHTVIEDVATRPGQGIASSGNFMKAVGVCYGVAAVSGSVSWVVPAVWKRHFNLIGQSKEASRQSAITRYGEASFRLKKDTDKAEAALIGSWYVETAGKKLLALLGSVAVGAGNVSEVRAGKP